MRDGLKPSQRRILVAMNDLNLTPGASRVKCAKISGDTSGNYHPHGESVIYPTLVRMAQEWNMRHVLIDKQGNFGSIAGLPPAAMRYTEARMSPYRRAAAGRFEARHGRFHSDLRRAAHRADGAAVEVPESAGQRLQRHRGRHGHAAFRRTTWAKFATALVRVIDDPDVSIDELLEICPGPDFPTGGIIMGRSGIRRGYHTGRSTITLRARAQIEEHRQGPLPHRRQRNSVPAGPRRVEEKIAELINEDKINGISAGRNESDLKEPVRLVYELKRDADPEVVLNQLYQFSPLQDTFSLIFLALVDGKPRVLSFKELLEEFIRHRADRHSPPHAVLAGQGAAAEAHGRRLAAGACQYRRSHSHHSLLGHAGRGQSPADGRRSAGRDDAAGPGRRRLRRVPARARRARHLHAHRRAGRRHFADDARPVGQSGARKARRRASASCWTKSPSISAFCPTRKTFCAIIRSDCLELKRKHGDERRTEISGEEIGEINLEDLITEETMVVSISHNGYIKRTPVSTYRAQRRGGKGIIGAKTEEEDPIQHLFVASTHDYLLFFTNHGKVYWQKVYDLPQLSRESRGRAVVNLLNLAEGEKIANCLTIRDFSLPDHYLAMATRKGLVKKTALDAYSRPKRGRHHRHQAARRTTNWSTSC